MQKSRPIRFSKDKNDSWYLNLHFKGQTLEWVSNICMNLDILNSTPKSQTFFIAWFVSVALATSSNIVKHKNVCKTYVRILIF